MTLANHRPRTLRRALWAASVLVCGVIVFGWFTSVPTIHADSEGNLVKNGGFEENASGTPPGWSLDAKVAAKGRVSLSTEFVHSGKFSLKLMPNQKNKPPGMANNPFGIGQGWPGASLRGKKLYLSAWMRSEGGATAIFGVYVLMKNGGLLPTELRQAPGSPNLVYQEDIAVVPDRGDILAVIAGCVVEGTSGAAYFDDVRVGTEPGAKQAEATPAAPAGTSNQELTGTIVVDANQTVRQIPKTLYGTNLEWIWDGNGVWDGKNNRLQPEILKLTRDLKPTVFRFPGGIFADFYHWKDGVTPLNARPETPHMPGGPTSVHRFGTNEALSFAEQTGGELMITVNMVTGTPQEAADWVRYVNRDGRTRVKYWEIGNESYVTGDMPAQKAAHMTPSQYSRRFLEFARAMKAADPSIKIFAIGDENFGTIAPRRYPGWTEEVLRTDAANMDYLSIHNGYSPGIFLDKGWDVRTTYEAMLASPELIAQSLDDVAGKIKSLAPQQSGRIRIAVTEWGPLFQAGSTGRFLDHVKTLGSALFVADTMMVMAKNPSVEMANFFQLVDSLYMGWIGPRAGTYVAKAPYFAFQMFTAHTGSTVVRSSSTSPTYSSRSVGSVDAVPATPYLDVLATRSSDGKTLFLMAVNKDLDRPIRTHITINGVHPQSNGTVWTLNGTGIDANTGTELFKAPGVKWPEQAAMQPNPRFDRGGPQEISFGEAPLRGVAAQFDYTFPAHSVTSLQIPARD